MVNKYTLILCLVSMTVWVTAQNQSDMQCDPPLQNITQGDIFFNFGSVTDAYSVRNRTSYSLGQPVVGNGVSQSHNIVSGFWSRFIIPPLPPIVYASQGELLDRIQLSWEVNPLGAQPSEGFKLFRDGVFLALLDKKTRNYNDFNVIAGRAYNYEVRGINEYGESMPGKAIGFQVPNGVVTGWIQTPSGRPVPDAFVALTPLQGFSAKFEADGGAFAKADTSTSSSFVPALPGEWTITFWVKTANATADAGILSLSPFPMFLKPIPSSTGHEGVVLSHTHNSAALITAQFPDSTKNDWHHIALSVDADGTARLYVDGTLIGISDGLPLIPVAEELRIGTRTEATGTWAGMMDELRIYHRRMDELDFGEVMMGTASSQTPDLEFYWKMDEELGTGSFDVLRRNKLYFCNASFNEERPYVRTMGKTNDLGFYRIESASYGTGTTFLAQPMKDFYMYRALKFTRNMEHYALLPDFSITPKATLELWVNSAGPDGDQTLISKNWPGNEFRILLTPNGNTNDVKFYLNGSEHNFGQLGMGYQHLAFTLERSGNSLMVHAYKGGVLLGTHTFPTITGDWSDPTQNWVLGARPSGMTFTDHYGGLIDEVALYDTTLSLLQIQKHFFQGRDMAAKGLRVYFAMDEGSGNRLNNTGSVLLTFGTKFGPDWTPFAARQKAEPHLFTPATRQVTLNPSVTSVDQVDFTDRSTIPVSGYVRYKNTDCFAKNVEIQVNGESFKPKVFTDSTGRFVIDFDPGTTAILTPVFEDHQFIPAFWEVFNVSNPIAGILFNDITTRKISGQVAGGLCKKSVIQPPPGMGQGTVCVVKVRSVDGCLERQIIIDNQEGEFEFDELPPLESMTVAVVEHSDPDVKSAFQVQGGYTVDLSKKDTIVDFIYFAPPEVIINDGLTPVPGCVPELFVFDQGEFLNLDISLIERYVPILDNMNMVIDDGICPLDSASFHIINGFADITFDTTMSGGLLKYKFQVGTPNPSPPFLKSLQIIGSSLSDREGSLIVQGIVTGIRNKENTFTTLLPETPSVVLRDPPGDGSFSFLEKNTKTCKTYAVSFDYEVGGGAGIEFHLGGNVEVAIGIGVATIMNAGPIFDIGAEFQVTYQKITDSTFQTCMSVSENIATSDGDLIVGGDNGADIFMGEAINIIFGLADQVTFDFNTCMASSNVVVNVEPGDFATVFMYSQFHIENNVQRYLELLGNLPDNSPQDSARYAESLTRWQAMLDRNAGLKEKAKLVRNISFDAGINYQFSETADTSSTSTETQLLNSEATAETHFGFEFNKAGVVGMVKFVSATSDSEADGDEEEKGRTVGYVLSDDDPGDAFTVDVAMDSVFKTPVFRLKAGQSSCPWEPGTANREGPNLALGAGSQFVAVNVPAHEPAVFKMDLGNLSATNEDWTYGFTAVAANNPDGAIIKLNGQQLNNNTIQFIVPFGTTVPITITVERGPIEYDYDNLLVALVSECEMARNFALSLPLDGDPNFFSPIYIGAHFIRPCSEVDVNFPEQNWVVLNNDPVQPGTIRRITVSGYDLNATDFQLVRVQYRRADGDGAWINIPGIHDRYNPNWSGFADLPDPKPPTLGAEFTQFFWETAGLSDGPYEIHAWAVCTGDASDKPGFSDIISGRIDREPPSLVGTPQPSDGVYHVGDEISFTFNKHINCDKLIPADQTQPNNVGLYDTTTDDLIDINVTCFENKIIIDPLFDNKYYENRIIRAELHDIEDKTGNTRSYLDWEFYVDRNELAWLSDSMGMTKFDDENRTMQVNIHNRGGYPVPFKILGAPEWVHISPDQGTLVANEIRPISFSVDSTLAFGYWSDEIILHTETGINPFFMGGDEPLPIGVRVVCRPPYGPVFGGNYENTMSMVLRVNIEGTFSSDTEDIVAAYIDDQLRGKANVQYVPLLNTYLAYLTVFGNPDDMLESIRLEVWDASTCQRYGSVIENFTFQPDNVIGVPHDPQIIHTNGLLLREVPFNYGWNWLSFNLAFPDNSLNTALASLSQPENDLIRSQTAFAMHSGGWFGPLTNLNNITMYIYRTDERDTLRMTGTLIDPATTPIALSNGWNWIGYVPNYSLPIDLALSTVAAQPGDVVKSQVAFAQFTRIIQAPDTFYRWIGNLRYMMPPNGYQLKLSNAATLIYPDAPANFDGQIQAKKAKQPADFWMVDPSRFEHSSTLIGMLHTEGLNVTSVDMELGAFVGSEVRGTAKAIYIEPLDAYLFFLTTYANTQDELIHYKIFDAATGNVHDLKETFFFSPNQHLGSIEEPIPFGQLSTGTPVLTGREIDFEVLPNPFWTETTLNFTLPFTQDVSISITDAQGREVAKRQLRGNAGRNQTSWNGRSNSGEWLPSGVYVVRLQTELGILSRKVVLQRIP